jgi:predicted AAA+ superfamily ATPase
MTFIDRPVIVKRIHDALAEYPVTLLLGPRQCGKTTIARAFHKANGGAYFDLEDPETPLKPEIAKQVMKELKGLIVIDEFQRQPELFPLVRVLVDREDNPARFLILGSASTELVRGVSESLAGRVAYVDMSGFSMDEVGDDGSDNLWVRGGFPNAFLAKNDDQSYQWRLNFIASFLERDIPQLGIRVPAYALRRFWVMVAHHHGNIWNAAELGRAMGTKEDTARKYLDIMSGSYMVRQLPPWFSNTGKRLVKAPKIFIRDSGMLHALLGLKDRMQIHSHPKLGFSWEGFAIEQILLITGAEKDAYFYKTHGGAELDLLIMRGGKQYGFEFKYSDAPKATKAMHVVFNDLNLEKLWVLYPGEKSYPLAEGIDVVPLKSCRAVLEKYGQP